MSKQLKVRALEKFVRQFTDELSLDEGEELLIKRTSMCTWWYAQNRHGLEGLIPMHHLEIIEGDYMDYSDLAPAEFEHIENTIFTWKIEKVTQLIFQNQKNNAEEQSTLLHCLRKLYTLMSNPDQRYYFMQQQGIDRLLNIATGTYDIAIQLFCLRNVIFLLSSPDAKRFPTQMNIPEAIKTVMDNCRKCVKGLEICCDALSNACYQNPLQCNYASSSRIVDILIAIMSNYKHSFGIQYAATKALANLCVDAQAHRHFQEKDISAMIENLKAQFPEKTSNMNAGLIGFQQKQAEYAVQVLNVLYFLVQHFQHAQTFALKGGFEVLPQIYNAVGTWDQPVRQSLFALLQKLAQGKGALLFGERLYEGFDMLFTFLYPIPWTEEDDITLNNNANTGKKKGKKSGKGGKNGNNNNNNNEIDEKFDDDFGDLPSAGIDLKMHFSSDFFAQIFNILVMVVMGLATGNQGALKPSIVQGAITRGFLRKNLKKICQGALQQSSNENLMNCVAALMALSGQAIFKLLEDVQREKMRGNMQQSANQHANQGNQQQGGQQGAQQGAGGNGGGSNPLYGAHGGFISPEAAALQSNASIGISDQIQQDAQGFQDVLIRSQIMNDMIKCCLDTSNQTVANDFLKNTFVTMKFLSMEEVKKWSKENIDYFVDNTQILLLITGKWYKQKDSFNQSSFQYTFQTVHAACFLLRGILTTMTRVLSVTEQERVNEFVTYLSQGQRNDVSPDIIKDLQHGVQWKQKKGRNPKQQSNGNNNNKQKGKQQQRQGQARPPQRQGQQQQQQQRQGQARPANNGKQNKDDCSIM